MNATNAQTTPSGRSGFRAWAALAGIAGLVLVYFLVMQNLGDRTGGTQSPAVGRKLPFFDIEPLTGESRAVSLDDLEGHVTLVNFWGTWCPPCRREFPHIVELAHKFADQKDFNLYAVSCGQENDEDLDALRSETRSFLESAKVNLPTYADLHADSRRAMTEVLDGARFGYPTTLVLDRQGTIRGMWVGYSAGTELEMQRLVEELLSASSSTTERS